MRSPKLREVTFFLHIIAKLRSLHTVFNFYDDEDEIDHRGLALHRSLATQKDSLEILSVWDSTYYHGGPILRQAFPSFYNFSVLKHLSLPDSILLGVPGGPLAYFTDPPAVTARFLRGFLPPSLETFTHLLWAGQSHYDEYIDTPTRLGLWRLVWNEEGCAGYFPNLKRVDQAQTYRANCYDYSDGNRFTIWRKLPVTTDLS
jgi:hypothetical protein